MQDLDCGLAYEPAKNKADHFLSRHPLHETSRDAVEGHQESSSYRPCCRNGSHQTRDAK